jgi:hypothetical protein
MKYFYDFKFYSHKILGLVLFFALSIIIDALLYITKVKTIFIPTSLIIQICYVYLYSITLTYRKYLMEEKYMSAFKVCSIYGLIDLFAQIILDIIYYNYGSFLYHNKKVVTFSILPSIKTNNNFSNSFLKSIPYIICYVLFYCFYYLLIDKFSVIHGVIMEIITMFGDILFRLVIESDIIYIISFAVLFLFIVISLFVYIEVIELKCCGLNKNTRRKILDRVDIDNINIKKILNDEEDELAESKVLIDNQYIIEMN